jgi:hypothetical protein
VGFRSVLVAVAVLWTTTQPLAQPPAPPNGAAVHGGIVPVTAGVKPRGIEGIFTNRLDATFGNERPDATLRNKHDLDQIAYYRFINGDAVTTGNGTDGLYDNYRSRHRDYPEGDPRSLHVFTGDSLILKAHCGLETSLRTSCSDGNIESGILRFGLAIGPGSIIEIRCRMPPGMYAWPAFWLTPGVEIPPATPGGKPSFTARSWPPEIDIFDQFGFNDTAPGHYLISGTPTNGNDAAYGNPHDTYRDPAWGEKTYYQPRQDLTSGFHVYALDWGTDHTLKYLLDGKIYRETHFEWNSAGGVPAHLIASLQIGPKFNDLSGIADQGGQPHGWDWAIDYIRVWAKGREERR